MKRGRRLPTRQEEIDRFWSKVKKTESCWLWTRCCAAHGYGHVVLFKKQMGAHQASVILSGRKLPKGSVVMHTCDNPKCVNPSHLVVGTYKENIQDYLNKHPERRMKPKIKKIKIPAEKTKLIATRMTESKVRQIDSWCKDAGITRYVFVRSAILDRLEKITNKQGFENE